MAKLPAPEDPTLIAIDRAMEVIENNRKRRGYLGMSSLGRTCERNLWYDFRWVDQPVFDASALKRFADGHAGEDVQANRLRLVQGVTLITVDPQTGRQIGFSDHDDHLKGHADGLIHGLVQAPSTWHIWEHKQVDPKKQDKLASLILRNGEKNAFREWDQTYYGQAMLYCHYYGATRHYLTVSTPGGRHTISCRSNADEVTALRLISRGGRIIKTSNPPPRISNDPAWFECRWCSFRAVCHEGAGPARNCRTCLHSTPVADGAWRCGMWRRNLTYAEQEAGCPAHLFLPGLIPGEQVDAAHDGEWVEYRLSDGSLWRNTAELVPF